MHSQKKATTSMRLHQLMMDRNLRQVDILELAKPFCRQYGVKLNKNDLSQYCSGKVEPRQDKLTILGLALNVSEAWLMGYDVPIDRDQTFSQRPIVSTEPWDPEADDSQAMRYIARGLSGLNEQQKQQYYQMGKVLFGWDFDEEGNKRSNNP